MQPTDQLDITIHSVQDFLGSSAQKKGEAFGSNIAGLSGKLSPECFAPTPH